jgi:hypothetical protein
LWICVGLAVVTGLLCLLLDESALALTGRDKPCGNADGFAQ